MTRLKQVNMELLCVMVLVLFLQVAVVFFSTLRDVCEAACYYASVCCNECCRRRPVSTLTPYSAVHCWHRAIGAWRSTYVADGECWQQTYTDVSRSSAWPDCWPVYKAFPPPGHSPPTDNFPPYVEYPRLLKRKFENWLSTLLHLNGTSWPPSSSLHRHWRPSRNALKTFLFNQSLLW